MDWFERLTGFAEQAYEETRGKLSVVDGRLRCLGTDRSYAVGTLTLSSLEELRTRAGEIRQPGRLRLSVIEGDIRDMHRAPENRGALIQVASQFNMLEMASPQVTPEEGVTRYATDRTQGPACAMAASAATIYRNYLAPVNGGIGQTSGRQLNGLADLGAAMSQHLGVAALWVMRNGYALATRSGLAAIAAYLREANPDMLERLQGLLRVGLHADVEVTDGPVQGLLVSQIFCSALPVAYSGLPRCSWAPFARLVLDAAYEATLLAGLLNAERGASNRVLLTRVGGGVFGNDDEWIDAALLRPMRRAGGYDLDVVLVSYGQAPNRLRDLVQKSGFA